MTSGEGFAPTTGGRTGLDTNVAFCSDSTLDADASGEVNGSDPEEAVTLSGVERGAAKGGRGGGGGGSDLDSDAGVTRCLPRVCLLGRPTWSD